MEQAREGDGEHRVTSYAPMSVIGPGFAAYTGYAFTTGLSLTAR